MQVSYTERFTSVGRIPPLGNRREGGTASQTRRGALLCQALTALLPRGYAHRVQVRLGPGLGLECWDMPASVSGALPVSPLVAELRQDHATGTCTMRNSCHSPSWADAGVGHLVLQQVSPWTWLAWVAVLHLAGCCRPVPAGKGFCAQNHMG